MATNLEQLGGEMKNVEGQLSQYDANLPSAIESQIQKAYTPALQQSLGVTKDLMGDYLGRYYDTTTMGPGMAGTTAKDLSPTQKLGVMGRELGTMAGELQYSQNLSDYLGGQMSDMYSKAMQAAQMGQQNLADQYARISQQYQMAWQEAEAEKDRALQRELAASSGSGGNTYIDYGSGGAPTDTSTTGQPIYEILDDEPTWTDKAAGTIGGSIAGAREAGGTFADYNKGWKDSSFLQKINPLYGMSYAGATVSDLLGNLFKKK